MSVAVCNICGAKYKDFRDVEMVRKMQKEGYAPCPCITCKGELELKKA